MLIPKDITEYLKVYKNFLDQDLCDRTVKKLKEIEWSKHNFTKGATGETVSYDDDLSVTWVDIPEKFEIHSKIWGALEQYIIKDFSNFKPWYAGWNGYHALRFNRYDVNTKMAMHCDHIHSMFDGNRKGVPILSIVASLNNDYEGGEFVMWEDQIIDFPAGSVMIFPSNFMFPHRVQPVTKGIRFSCVSWSW